MARHEKNIAAASEAKLALGDVMDLLVPRTKKPMDEARYVKLARLLSGEDDGEALGGSFADSRLSGGKES